jgi:hypothetical protein
MAISPQSIFDVYTKRKVAEKVNNWSWDGEQNFIDLVEKNQSEGMIVVEIGCYDGATTRKYIDTVKKNNGHVIVIDTFAGTIPTEETKKLDPNYAQNQNNPHWKGSHNYLLYDTFLEKFKDYRDMMTIHKGFSFNKIPLLPDNCDIIFIDADHIYESVKKDIELSLPKVKKGGILSGHDLNSFDYVNTYTQEELRVDFYNGHHPGVSQAVFEFFGKTETSGSVWYTTIK